MVTFSTSEMPTVPLPLDPKEIKRWPATPTEDQMDLAIRASFMMQNIHRLTVHHITIPAFIPEDKRPKELMHLTAPDGRTLTFDSFHRHGIDIPQDVIMPEHKLRHAQGLNMCLQALNMADAAADLHRQLDPKTEQERGWFILTAASLGDSAETIGIVIQQPAGPPGKVHLTTTKLSRDPVWMGYNPYLKDLKGTTFYLMAAHDSAALPAQVIGHPSTMLPQDLRGTPIENPRSNSEKHLLARILKYHGTDQCIWVRYEDTPYARI